MVSSLDNWDGSLSQPAKNNATRIPGMLNNGEASKTAINMGHGWQDMASSVNTVHDASNVDQPLSTAMSPINGSLSSPARNVFSFAPISSSPLHTKQPMVLALPNLVSSTGLSSLLSSMVYDPLEMISTHSADGEGENEDDLEGVSDILTYPVHDQNLNTLSCDSPLFTPPPEEDPRSINTPSSSSNQSPSKPPTILPQPRPQRLIMSHIQVPPFKRPRSDYQPLQPSRSVIVNNRRAPKKPHSSLQDALQASIHHNADLGVLPSDSLAMKQKKQTKQGRENGESIVVARSSASHSTIGYNKVVGHKKRSKRSEDDDEWGAPPRATKRPRPTPKPIVVDLTITTDDDEHSLPPSRAPPSSLKATPVPSNPGPKPRVEPTNISKPLPKPRPVTKSKFVHAAYDVETDTVTLCLDDIRPVSLDILAHNTRLLRQSLGMEVGATPGPSRCCTPTNNINCTRRSGSRSCFLSINAEDPSPIVKDDGVDEISVGGVVWELFSDEEEKEKDVNEILSEKENVLPVKNVDGQVSKLKNQQQQKKKAPHKQRQRQPTADDTSLSSAAFFKAPVDVSSLPPPRAIASDTQGIPTPQYPRTQYPKKKKGRESEHDQQQQGMRQKKQTQEEEAVDNNRPSSTTINDQQPSTIRVATPQHYRKESVESRPQQVPVRPLSPHDSPRSSLVHDQTLGSSGSDYHYLNGAAIPSAKALGKRRAVSPISSISVATTTTTPHQISNSSQFVVQNSDFASFVNYYPPPPTAMSPSAAVQQSSSSSAQVNGVGSVRNTSYHPFDTLTSLYDEAMAAAAASASRSQADDMRIGGDDLDSNSRRTSNHAHTRSLDAYDFQPHTQPPLHESAGSRGDSSFFSTPDPLYEHRGYDQEPLVDDDPWSASLVTHHHHRQEDQYAYDDTMTIDPTLLGGGACFGEDEGVAELGMEIVVDADLESVEMEAESETGMFDDQGGRKEFVDLTLQSSSSSPSLSSTFSSRSTKEKKKKQKKKKKFEAASIDEDPELRHNTEEEEDETYGRKLPRRKRTKRVMPDMISHDDIDLLRREQKAAAVARRTSTPATSSVALDEDSEVGDQESDDEEEEEEEEDDQPTTIRKPISTTKPHVASIKKPSIAARSVSPVVAKPMRDPNQEWPLVEVDAYCHQCRRKTFYAKMTCSDCQKKFCVRCYAFRYPECEFDLNDEEYSCPACEGFCNCTACCRKRGEPYVGVRTIDPDIPLPPVRQRPRNTKAKTNALVSAAPAKTMVVETTAIPKGVTKTWGSLYSVTGERIGACFFDPSAEKDESVVFAPVTTPIITTITEVARQMAAAAAQTTTVGGGVVNGDAKDQIQVKTNLNLKKRKRKLKRRIFIGEPQPSWGYRNPKIKLLKPEPYSKRSYNSMPRFYIGKKKCLFYQVEEEWVSSPSSSSSSLTPVGESDEGVNGCGAEGKSFSPGSLGDGDISRAILLGLNACGVPAAIEVELPVI